MGYGDIAGGGWGLGGGLEERQSCQQRSKSDQWLDIQTRLKLSA